jgi:hypothetical protein
MALDLEGFCFIGAAGGVTGAIELGVSSPFPFVDGTTP